LKSSRAVGDAQAGGAWTRGKGIAEFILNEWRLVPAKRVERPVHETVAFLALRQKSRSLGRFTQREFLQLTKFDKWATSVKSRPLVQVAANDNFRVLDLKSAALPRNT
jgi:hypothetical protein